MKSKLLIIILTLLIFIASCKKKEEEENILEFDENPIVCITLSNNKTITLELYPESAPITVSNFLKLVDSNFYEGTIFHRVIDGFMIQTGGYTLKGNTIYQLDDTPSIKGEFLENGITNNISHKKGVISMARTNNLDSASGQFFICSEDSLFLDGKYAAFGCVVDQESLDAVVEISKLETVIVNYLFQDFPVEPISIVSIERVIKNDEPNE